MKKYFMLILTVILAMSISACGGDDSSSGTTAATTDSGNEQNNEGEDTFPATFYESFEASGETADIASLIVPSLTAPYTMESFDSLEGEVLLIYATSASGYYDDLSTLFQNKERLSDYDATIKFNQSQTDETIESSGVYEMTIYEDEEEDSTESMSFDEAFNSGKWSLQLSSSEIYALDSADALYEFVETYGSPTSVRLWTSLYDETALDENNKLIKTGDSYSPIYSICYEYDAYTIEILVYEYAFDNQDETLVKVSYIAYYPVERWEEIKVERGYTD